MSDDYATRVISWVNKDGRQMPSMTSAHQWKYKYKCLGGNVYWLWCYNWKWREVTLRRWWWIGWSIHGPSLTLFNDGPCFMLHDGTITSAQQKKWGRPSNGVISTAVCYHNCVKRSYTMNTFIWSRAIKFTRWPLTQHPWDSHSDGSIPFFGDIGQIGIKLIGNTLNKGIYSCFTWSGTIRIGRWPSAPTRPDPSGGSQGSNKGQIPFFRQQSNLVSN